MDMCLSVVVILIAIVLIYFAYKRFFRKKLKPNEKESKVSLPGMKTAEKVSEQLEVPALKIMQGGRRLVLGTMKYSSHYLDGDLSEESYPVVTPMVMLHITKPLAAGTYNVYLCSDKGSTVGLRKAKPVTPQTDATGRIIPGTDIESMPEDPEKQEKAEEKMNLGIEEKETVPAELREDKTVWAVYTDPTLSARYLRAGTFSNALAVMGSRLGLIVGLIIGGVVTLIVCFFVVLVLRLMRVF